MVFPVCILTAGRGTRMGPYAGVINKALLPYEGKAVLSHIMDGFPQGTPFVIALGHGAQQVRDYLLAAHPDDNVTFVTVENLDGPGSGPGHSLWCCREHLQRPFYMVTADTVARFNADDTANENWMGVAQRPPQTAQRMCNVTLDTHGFINKIYDKVLPPLTKNSDPICFTGLLFIKDYAEFWAALSNPSTAAGEVQISAGLAPFVAAGTLRARTVEWKDFGTYDDYRALAIQTQPYDFSKTDEFIYFRHDRVIKFFADPEIVKNRVAKAALRPDIFPAVTFPTNEGNHQIYAYGRVPGETVYQSLTPSKMTRLLEWLDEAVWQIPVNVNVNQFAQGCRDFYEGKTRERLAAFRAKNPGFIEPKTLNGMAVRPMDSLLAEVNFDALSGGLPRFIHGDLQFDNIIDDGERFTLIDWRQDFAGEILYGDWYYDLAKLLGGIYVNYDLIKLGQFTVHQNGTAMDYDFARRANTFAYQEILREYAAGYGLDWRRVMTITALIYLNMAPLHAAPFDALLYGLSQQLLTEILSQHSAEPAGGGDAKTAA